MKMCFAFCLCCVKRIVQLKEEGMKGKLGKIRKNVFVGKMAAESYAR